MRVEEFINLKLKNNNKGIQLINEDIDINLSVNNLSLTKKTSPEYFKKYFSLVKNDINCLLFENYYSITLYFINVKLTFRRYHA